MMIKIDLLLKIPCVIVGSALAYYFSSGFGAIWYLSWVAPILVLAYGYRENLFKLFIVALIVGLAPGLNQIIGYWPTHIPHSAFIFDGILQSVEWSIVVLLSCYFVQKIKYPISILAYPTFLCLLEWLQSFTITGNYNTLAYSQLHFLPIMQLASIAGCYGVTFCVSLFSSAVAYFIIFSKTDKKTWLGFCVSMVFIITCLIFGYWRIHAFQTKHSSRFTIGIASINLPIKIISDPKNALLLINQYRVLISQLTQQGATIILLPEESISVNDENISAIKNKISNIASDNHLTLIMGVSEQLSQGRFNSAWIYDPTGKLIGYYKKQHLVPGLENSIIPGQGILQPFSLSNLQAGIAICRDLDYPNPAHAYGKLNTNMLFVPAWDFDVDAYVHATGAYTRAIENGYTLIRAARNGFLSAVSPTGEILGSLLAITPGNFKLLVHVPVWKGNSFYATHGDWFIVGLWGELFILFLIDIFYE
ncbi:MAG: hypothetical protein KIT27_08225 [Legionellales bacterium]|nr:hypothetical protein [Legionellales bacterium]